MERTVMFLFLSENFKTRKKILLMEHTQKNSNNGTVIILLIVLIFSMTSTPNLATVYSHAG